MYWFAGTNEVHAEKTRQFSLKVNARQKKFLLQVAMIKILRPLPDAQSTSFAMDRVEMDV